MKFTTPALLCGLILSACGKPQPTGPTDAVTPATADTANGTAPDTKVRLTVYCGRSKAMVQEVFDAFERDTGIGLDVRYGDTTALANTLLEEGDASPADLFFAQDAGALGALTHAKRLIKLPADLLAAVDPRFAAPDGTWLGTSGRARVIAYNTDKLKPEDLPSSILGFTDPKWRGRIGWPPSNASFQAFVSALRLTAGHDATATWLRGIVSNEPRVYPKNGPAVMGVANGEVDVAFVNHYYLFVQKREAGDRPFPVANHYPRGDVGGMMNVAGVGVLTTSKKSEAALKLVAWLLREPAQKVFAHDNFEYPLAAGVAPAAGIPPISELDLPKVELGALRDLEATLTMLRETRALP
jgi:iron(III) transport system substrate-binding protein